MKSPPIKPIIRDAKKLIEKISETYQDMDDKDRVLILKESDLKKLVVNVIANVIVEMDANYVRSRDLRREVEMVLQEMIKANISPGGK